MAPGMFPSHLPLCHVMRESGDIGSAMKNIILPPVIFLALCLMLLDQWEWLS